MNQAAVRELADLYFGRFDARLEQRMAEIREELNGGLADQRADLLKWMFIFWAGTIAPLAGLIIALHKA